ncbi:MAG: 4Fe-4S dicluster domain-containing protein [Spirochaetia bacterium]|nr:4Fe-4S dicluster domain-containing protein [Spirochaetia bacterium]
MFSVSETKLYEVFAKLQETGKEVFLPVDTEKGEAEFSKWQQGTKLSQALNTVRSAKDFFFPQTENLVNFKIDGKNIEIEDIRTEGKDFIIFGARACDVASFSLLDMTFLADPIDTYYANRRKHGIIISLACSKPAATCFCPLFGIDATQPNGDIDAYQVADRFFFTAKSDKGKALLEEIKPMLDTSSDDKEVEEQKVATKEILGKLPFANLDLSRFKGENMKEIFNSKAWESLSQMCLGCGTCTFVCPTCQCFDIRDFDTGHGIKRFRCWDSCMYSDFTQMAAANPRHTQKERFRQRFMHKLVYYPQNYDGTYGCVGCGRCLNKCPISMNIVKVIKKLGEEQW